MGAVSQLYLIGMTRHLRKIDNVKKRSKMNKQNYWAGGNKTGKQKPVRVPGEV